MSSPWGVRLIIGGTIVVILFQLISALLAWDNTTYWISAFVAAGLGLALIYSQLSLRTAQAHLICANTTIIELKQRLQQFYGPPMARRDVEPRS